MKLTAQATTIDGVTHILFSPQWGTDCGIRMRIKEEDIVNVADCDEITCSTCLQRLHRNMAWLKEISEGCLSMKDN